jgi:Tol biopolymer transport system component
MLVMLVRNNGHLLEKDELIRSLWPDSFVEEGNLSNNIFVLRKALGNDHEYIETVPRRGYRFVGAVRQLPGAEKPPSEPPEFPSAGPGDPRQAGPVPVVVSPAIRRQRHRFVLLAAIGLMLLAIGAALWWRNSSRLPDRSQWVQLTRFPDSVVQPALSPDGHMVAFIHGYGTFVGPGQIYVKILPDGQPVELTHDNAMKMSPAFSPDGSRIAYSTVDPQHWDTAVVPTLGGAPQPWLRNASSLAWTGPQKVLFSEIKSGLHMGIVAAQESRIGARDVYFPESERWMAHHSYSSPDGKWVLVVEMDEDHRWLPCRLAPMDGGTKGRYVGPLGGGCTAAAWTPNGKWMYFTSDHGGVNHIWRQRFPDGRPEQVTSGPTEEEGIAMAPDGRSFVTAVALQSISLWIHDAKGEHQVSLEGNGLNPRFTPDGKKLCYTIVRELPNQFAWHRNPGELRVADLESGRSEPLVPGLPVLEYDFSADGRLVVISTPDSEGKPQLWVMPFDRSSPPVQITSLVGSSPRFGAGNDIFFRHMDGKSEFVYCVRPDGTGLHKAIAAPVFHLNAVSPDGRWIAAWAPLGDNGPPLIQVFPLNGGAPIQIQTIRDVSWLMDGRSILIDGYLVPLKPGEILPDIPAGGFHSLDEVGRLPGAKPIDAEAFGPSADVYAFYKATIQRNLYRIPIS